MRIKCWRGKRREETAKIDAHIIDRKYIPDEKENSGALGDARDVLRLLRLLLTVNIEAGELGLAALNSPSPFVGHLNGVAVCRL